MRGSGILGAAGRLFTGHPGEPGSHRQEAAGAQSDEHRQALPAEGNDTVPIDVGVTEQHTVPIDETSEDQQTVPIPDRRPDPGPENVGVLLSLVVGILPARSRWRPLGAAAARLVVLSPRGRPVPGGMAPVLAALWAVAAGWLAALILAVCVMADTPAEVAAWIWLAANHAPVTGESGTVSVLPLGLMLAALLPLRRAGRYVVTHCEPAGLRGAAVAALATYSIAAAVVAAAWGGGHFSVPTTAAWAALCALLGGAWAWLRQRPGHTTWPPLLSGVLRAAAAPLVLGGLLLVGALVVGWQAVAQVQGEVATTPAEHAAMVLLQAAYLPNLVIWAGAYAVGAGVAFGPETVSPYSDGTPLLPDLPLVHIAPLDSPNWTAMLPIAVAVGAALAAIATNRRQPLHQLGRRISRAFAMSAGTAACWFVLGLLAGGSLGDGPLDYIGPAAGTPIVAGLATLAGTLLWAILPTVASDARPVARGVKSRVAKSKETIAAGAQRRKD